MKRSGSGGTASGQCLHQRLLVSNVSAYGLIANPGFSRRSYWSVHCKRASLLPAYKIYTLKLDHPRIQKFMATAIQKKT